MYLTGLTDNEIIIVVSIYVITSVLNIGLYMNERKTALITTCIIELLLILGFIFFNYISKIIYYSTEELLPLLTPSVLGIIFSLFINKDKIKTKKNNTSKIVILVGGIFLIFIFGTYIGYLMFKSIYNNNQPQQVIEKKEEISINDPLVLKLMKIPEYTIQKRYNTGLYQGYFYNGNYYDINSITDDVKVFIAIQNIKDNSWNDLANVILSKEKIDESMKQVFGPNVKYTPVSTNDDPCIYGNFTYDGNTFSYSKSYCENELSSYYDKKIISAYKYSDRIEITEKVIYYEDNDNIKIVKNTNGYEIAKDNNPNIDNYLDKLESFKFTFTKIDNDYYLSKVEKM